MYFIASRKDSVFEFQKKIFIYYDNVYTMKQK